VFVAVQVSPDHESVRGVIGKVFPLQFSQRGGVKQTVCTGRMATIARHRILGQWICREGDVKTFNRFFYQLRAIHISLIFTITRQVFAILEKKKKK
jgi:hypothetical protein